MAASIRMRWRASEDVRSASVDRAVSDLLATMGAALSTDPRPLPPPVLAAALRLADRVERDSLLTLGPPAADPAGPPRTTTDHDRLHLPRHTRRPA